MLYDRPLIAPVLTINPTAGTAALTGEPIAAGVDEKWLSSASRSVSPSR